MNIKSVLSPTTINSVKNIEKVDRSIQADTTHDRDPNSQGGFSQNRKEDEPLTEEEISKALGHLKDLPFVKEHGWQIEMLTEGLVRFVLVKDSKGQLIRRFPESDLRTLPIDPEDKKGQFLKKSA